MIGHHPDEAAQESDEQQTTRREDSMFLLPNLLISLSGAAEIVPPLSSQRAAVANECLRDTFLRRLSS